MKYCTNCGEKFLLQRNYCTSCGCKKIDLKPEVYSEQKTTGINTSRVAIIILALFLFLSNPSQLDFSFFAKSKVVEQFKPDGDESSQFVSSLMTNLISKNITETTIRNDYIFFSTYTVDLTGLQLLKQDLPDHMKFLGITGIFIPF